jgi:hypothetical protein
MDDLDNVTLAYTLRNIGNIADGLDVTLSTNIYTGNGLIPPSSSEWESVDGTPNHFILNDIPPDSTVTFRAWMQLPRDQELNGTAQMTLEMRSTLEPDILFTNRTEYEYLAEAWRPENIVEESNWDRFKSEVQILWNEWNQILFSAIVTLIGAIVLHRAVVYRQRRDAEWNAMIAARHVEPEKAEDWMGKFSEKNPQTPVAAPSATMDAGDFKKAFQMRSKTKPVRASPSDEVVDAAHTVFEHHDEIADYEALEGLTEELLDESEPHEANQSLAPSESVDSRTVRHPRKETKTSRASSRDDIDLDL